MLRSVAFGYVVAGEEFALWLGANHPLLSGDAAAPRPFRMLALWYLFTILPGTLGNEFVVTPWKREIGIDLALRAAKSFFRRIHVELMVGPKGVRDTWFPSEEFQGFRFVPISTGPLMRAEAARCRNCYDWYGHRIAVNDARLFSMRTADGRVVADIEVGRDETNPRRAAITQMKKPENKEPDPPLRAIGDAWLAAMLRRHGQPDMVRALVQEPDAARWHEIMAPLAAAGLLPEWARTAPTNANLSQFEDEFEKIGPPHSRRGWSYC